MSQNRKRVVPGSGNPFRYVSIKSDAPGLNSTEIEYSVGYEGIGEIKRNGGAETW